MTRSLANLSWCVLALLLARAVDAVDCNRNGVDDAEEVLAGTAQDCNGNGIPDGCDVSSGFGFPSQTIIDTGTYPSAVATGDFDGDGNPDAAYSSDGSVTVLLGDGRRGFSVAKTYASEVLPAVLAAADVNGDGRTDLVCAGMGLYVIFNEGGGTMSGRVVSSQGGDDFTVFVIARDLDGDGDADIAVGQFLLPGGVPRGSLIVYLNDGQGGFPRVATYPVAASVSISGADLDGDGDVDIVLAAPEEGLYLLRNHGNGELEPAQLLFQVPGVSVSSVVAADFNGDGFEDLAAGDYPGTKTVIYLNDGQGAFSKFGEYPVPGSFLSTGDLDGDGALDLVAASDADTATVLLNEGMGAFGRMHRYAIGPGEARISLEDMDLDGDLDMTSVQSESSRGLVVTIYNRGDGTFEAADSLPLPSNVRSTVSADFDGDGRKDFVALSRSGFTFLRNLGERRFTEVSFQPTNGSNAMAAGDFDGDGDPDLAIIPESSPGLDIFINAAGTFSLGKSMAFERSVAALAAIDLEGDGPQELALGWYQKVSLLQSDGAGSFEQAASVEVSGSAQVLLAGDFNGDARPDLAAVVTEWEQSSLSVLLQREDGSFAPTANLPLQAQVAHLAGGDLDRDGALELAAGLEGKDTVLILENDGEGVFSPLRELKGLETPAGIAFVPFGRDGYLGLFAACTFSQTLQAFPGTGDGGFSDPLALVAGYRPYSLAADDLDGDGTIDLIAANGKSAAVFFNEGGSESASADCNENGIPDECEMAGRDCNGNGILDECEAPVPEVAFDELFRYSPGGELEGFACGDFDGDALVDFAAATWDNGTVEILRNDGNRGLVVSQTINLLEPVCADAADLDGDRDLDLAIGLLGNFEGTGAGVAIQWNDGTGHFSPGDLLLSGPDTFSVLAADLNGDRDKDLAVTAGTLQVFMNQGNGTFSSRQSVVVPSRPFRAVAFDREGDGDEDLAVASADFGMTIVENRGGSFQVVHTYPVRARDIAAGDLNGDGAIDLAVSGTTLLVFMNDGTGAFREPEGYHYGDYTSNLSLAASDFDGDRDLDIAFGGRSLRFFRNDGEGNFLLPRDLGIVGNLQGFTARDLDGDGATDLIVENAAADAIVVLRNVTPAIEGDCNRNGLPDDCEPDCDGDGVPDGCESDCNANAVPDDCDLKVGTSQDANTNGIPDECEPDCNGNGIPDDRDLATGTSTDANSDGIPDECVRPVFHRGDADADGELVLSDVIFIFVHLFRSPVRPPCLKAADANGDRVVDISDGIFILEYLFRDGRAPPEPGPPPVHCGPGPLPSDAPDLSCERYDACTHR